MAVGVKTLVCLALRKRPRLVREQGGENEGRVGPGFWEQGTHMDEVKEEMAK